MSQILKMKSLLFFLLFAIDSFDISNATDCTLPSNNQVEQLLATEVNTGGGEGGTVTVRGGPYYVCQVQGTTMGTYQQLSAIMEYTTITGDRVGQFEMICQISPNGWGHVSESLTVILTGSGVTYDGSIGLRTNCSSCINTAGNSQHCVACHSSCNDGLMRCTGSTSDDCCVAFEENGVCKTDLNCTTNNFIANTQNNFTCACGLSCSDGYSLNITTCTCTLTDICLSDDNPCNNNGVCVLDTAPDQYTCNCTGTGYTGLNCSDAVPMPTSSPGGGTPVSGTPATPMSSSAPMATPSSTPITSCVENCSVCLNSTCCSECVNNYNVTTNGCTCVSVTIPRPYICDDRNCQECTSDRACCDTCEDGYVIDRRDRCSCVEISPSSSTGASVRPTSTGSDGGDRQESADLQETDIAVIIPSIILAILVLIVLIVVILYLVYYFVIGSNTAAAKAKLNSPFLPGEAHDNPMYVDPESFD